MLVDFRYRCSLSAGLAVSLLGFRLWGLTCPAFPAGVEHLQRESTYESCFFNQFKEKPQIQYVKILLFNLKFKKPTPERFEGVGFLGF